MPHQLLGQKIFLIIAHPDDEGFLAAGLLWRNHRSGGRNIIACASLGEKGIAHLKKPMLPTKLKALRRKEMRAAGKVTGVDRVYELGLPDGGIANALPQLISKCRSLIKREQPDVILSFGPDGYTAHRDHIACWKAASTLSKEFKLTQYAFTVPQTIAKRMPGWLMKQRYNPHYAKMKPYLKPTVSIPTPSGLKLHILRIYRSQVSQTKPYSHLPAYAAKMMSRAEYFASVRS